MGGHESVMSSARERSMRNEAMCSYLQVNATVVIEVIAACKVGRSYLLREDREVEAPLFSEVNLIRDLLTFKT